MAVVASTGGGKSTFCLNLIEQHLKANRGLVLFDPKKDLASAVLQRIPAHRLDDVVIIDPLDPNAVVGLNPLAGSESPDQIADGLLSVLKRLYGDGLGYRSEDILHAGLLALAHIGGQTLVALPTFLSNSNVRRRLLPRISNEPVLMQFFSWFDGLSEQERTAMLAAPLNKLRPFLYSRGLRRVLGQAKPRFSIDEVFTKRKILIVSLARGELGDASPLLGALLVSTLWRAIERRVSIDPERRHLVPIILDEVNDYLRLPLDLSEALAKARGYGAGFTIVAQSLALLPSALRTATLANARSKVLLTLGPDDARIMASASGGLLDASDFLRLPRFNTYLDLPDQGWLSGMTMPPSPVSSDPSEVVRRRSRERWGIPVSEIDRSLHEQLGIEGDRGTPPKLGRRSLV